jgi:hypothetical protein
VSGENDDFTEDQDGNEGQETGTDGFGAGGNEGDQSEGEGGHRSQSGTSGGADSAAGDGGSSSAEGDGQGDGAGSGEAKRIRDLQSARDRETARANRAERALQGLLKPGEGSSGSADPERQSLLDELRESNLDGVYAEFGELKTYEIDRALIEGQTRAEMRASAARVVALVKGVETKARNKALSDAGIKAEPVGTTRPAPKDYARMSAEDIEKEIARARSGGESLW